MTEDEDKERLMQDLATMRAGISPDALQVLEDRYGYHASLFSDDAMYSTASNEVYLRQALIKEGQRQVIQFIRFALKQQ